ELGQLPAAGYAPASSRALDAARVAGQWTGRLDPDRLRCCRVDNAARAGHHRGHGKVFHSRHCPGERTELSTIKEEFGHEFDARGTRHHARRYGEEPLVDGSVLHRTAKSARFFHL